MMELPRNIRQIGDIEQDLRLYMEDYVATFIEKIKRKNDTFVGVLLGRQEKSEEIPYLFVRGAVLVNDYEVEEDRICFSADAWNQVYEDTEHYFKEAEICGWFLCSSDRGLTDLYNLQKTHQENFKSGSPILILYDGDREEERFYRFDAQGAHRLRGHYIYYERNEHMQEYMISREPARKTELVAVPAIRGTSDDAARQFRAVMGEKKDRQETASGNHVISRVLRTVSVAALLCGAGFGLAAWYRYDGMQGAKEIIAVMAGQEAVQETETGTETEESGQAVIREISGNVYPTVETTPEQRAEEPTTASETDMAETAGTNAEETESEETEAETGTDAEAADAGSYQEYVVQDGDTLYQICKAIYGKGSSSMVDKICELNGMDNADFIYEGQILKLPQ